MSPRRWYQNVGVEGVTYEDPGRAGSEFWNEGKWRNFIEPLLPRERGTFVEIGCNAGLFLKLASDAGFRRVVGVEGNARIMRQAETYRARNGGTYELVARRAGDDLDPYGLPLADVVLMSNMHYYLPLPALARLVDELRNRCLRCVVVSARAKRRSGHAFHDLSSVRGYFRDWQELGFVENVDAEGDPAPRDRMYGVSFKGGLEARSVDGLYRRWCADAASSGNDRRSGLPPAATSFFRAVLGGEDVGLEDTEFFAYWTRVRKAGRDWTLDHLGRKRRLAEDVRDRGMVTPIYQDRAGKLLDGIHRLVIARELGHGHVLVRSL